MMIKMRWLGFIVFACVLFFVAPYALACGDPQDPNGCAADFYYEVGRAYESNNLKKFGEYLQRYPMRHLFDGDPKTAWVEAKSDSGVGMAWVIGSNRQELTFKKIKVVNGCASNPKMFLENNRVREIAIAYDVHTEYITLQDSSAPQVIPFKTPLRASKIWMIIKSVYSGAKYNDTCLSELRFITKETGEWPKAPEALVEMKPYLPKGDEKLYETTYTYPDYDVYHRGRKRGSIEGDGLEFFISPSGWAYVVDTITNSSKLVYLPDFEGSLDMASQPQPSTNVAEMIVVGWIKPDHLCIVDPKTVEVRLYVAKNRELKLEKQRTVVMPFKTDFWSKEKNIRLRPLCEFKIN